MEKVEPYMKKMFDYLTRFAVIMAFAMPFNGNAQEKVIIDQVVAVVGDNAILQSELLNKDAMLEGRGLTWAATLNVRYWKTCFSEAALQPGHGG